MAKTVKLADLAARAATVATPKDAQAPQGWDQVDTASDTASDAPQDAPQAITALASAKSAVTYGGLTLDLTKMTPQGIGYLLQYGYSQSLQDSAAGAKKLATDAHNTHMRGESTAFEKLCAEMDKSTDDMAKLTAAEFADAYAQHCRAERSEAIRTDSLGQRVGGGAGPVDPIAKLQRDIAKERIAAASKARGTKMPTGEALNSLVVQLLAGKHFDAIHAEAVRRHSALDIDLSDIL